MNFSPAPMPGFPDRSPEHLRWRECKECGKPAQLFNDPSDISFPPMKPLIALPEITGKLYLVQKKAPGLLIRAA